jgi:acetyl esterase/lipase
MVFSLNMKYQYSYFIQLFMLFVFKAGHCSENFVVTDSLIYQSSYRIVRFNNNAIGMPLWQEKLPDNFIVHEKNEEVFNRIRDLNQFGLNRAVRHVSKPSMFVFPVVSDTLSPAIIILPGGAFQRIALDKEGFDVANVLNQNGIAAIIVKYRTLPEAYWDTGLHIPDSIFQAMYSDARQAMRLIRFKANEFSINPQKIGVMGFSAGGALASNLLIDESDSSLHLNEADKQSIHPNFGCLIYPVITDSIVNSISPQTPPTFLSFVQGDVYASVGNVQKFYDALILNRINTKLQIYESGGHGYGLGLDKGDVAEWPAQFVQWLRQLK